MDFLEFHSIFSTLGSLIVMLLFATACLAKYLSLFSNSRLSNQSERILPISCITL